MSAARAFAADWFGAVGRPDLARMVRDGEGDDFAEVKAAAALLDRQAERIARYEQALAHYADPGFWDDGLPGGALAAHDGGEMARNVLAGKPAFFHRD